MKFDSYIFWAMLSAGFAGLTAIFAKVGIRDIDSDMASLIRTAIIFLILTAFVLCLGKWQTPSQLPAKTWLFLILSALATGASWVCYFRALQIGKASQVAPIDKLSVVLVALFAYAFLGERPSGQEWAGITLVTVGVILLVLKAD